MKGYILIDIPDNCQECPIGDNRSCVLETYIYCPIAKRGAIDVETETVPEWCPIKPLPERKHPCVNVIETVSNNGWNACLDAITREEE